MKPVFRLLLISLLLPNLLLASQALAADTAMGIVTGPGTGTYITFGRDIAALGKEVGVKVEVKESGGSIDNIRRINSSENAALGIVQSDVLAFMGRSDNRDTMRKAENLRMVFPLYMEEVHLLARREIEKFSDLEGKRVVVGQDGSGHLLTAINLFAMMNVTPSALLKTPPPEGLLDLLDGKVDAIIFVAGKPVKLFENLDSLTRAENEKFQPLLDSVHFVPLDEPRMLEEYRVGEINRRDYSFVKDPVPTLAVTAVLVTYDFSKHSKLHEMRCNQVKKIAGAIRKNLKQLQRNHHPKWREVSLDKVLPYWRKDSCSWGKTEQNVGTPKRESLSEKLQSILKNDE